MDGVKQPTLQEEGFEFEKVEVGYAVYDTNVNHDARLISNRDHIYMYIQRKHSHKYNEQVV